MTPVSLEVRTQILADCDAGMKTTGVAKQYNVSPAFVRRLKQRRRETGEVAPRTRDASQPRILAGREHELRQLIEEKQDRTADELRRLLGVDCSLATIRRERRRLGSTENNAQGE